MLDSYASTTLLVEKSTMNSSIISAMAIIMFGVVELL